VSSGYPMVSAVNKSLIRYGLRQVEELLDGTFLHHSVTRFPIYADLNLFSVSHWRKEVYAVNQGRGLLKNPSPERTNALIKPIRALRAEAVAYNLLLRVIPDGIPDK